MTILTGCIIGDHWQYKRIGETDFYLGELMSPKPDLYYTKNPKFGFKGVNQRKTPKHIFWNDSILVVKCSDKLDGAITNYCIIKMFKTKNCDSWEDYELIQYATHEEYVQAMNALGLKESEMCYTDNSIPWSLHLFD